MNIFLGKKLIKKNNNKTFDSLIFLMIGCVHGMTNLGGSLLALASARMNIVKEQVRFCIAYGYLIMGVFQLLFINLFINIASMQEMDNKTISKYFEYIRKNSKAEYFYCCNRIEKNLPHSEKIIFDKYPWLSSDKVLVEETCNWYKKYPISRYPFVKNFDGLIKHKLIKIK